MIFFTPREKELLKFGKEKGYLTLQDFYNAYKTNDSRRQTIDKFRRLGLIQEVAVHKFKILDENKILDKLLE